MPDEPLKIKAADDEDLEVFASVLHEAPMPLAEVTYLEPERRFAALFRRHIGGQARGRDPRQVDCALVFEDVASARALEIGGLGGKGSAALMTIVSEQAPAGGVTVTLVFRGGGQIQLEAGSVRGRLADIGAPVPAQQRPRHAYPFDR